MIKLDDIKQQTEELKKNYKDFQAYTNQVKEIEGEKTELEALGESKLSITQAIRLAKVKEELAIADKVKNEATKNLYPVLYDGWYGLSELMENYMLQEIKSDKELDKLKQEYSKTKEKLLRLAVEHDTKYSDKLENMKKEISDIGYFTLVEEIASNKDAKLLGLNQPSTYKVRYFNPEQFKINFPDGMAYEYNDAMNQYKAKKTFPWFGMK